MQARYGASQRAHLLRCAATPISAETVCSGKPIQTGRLAAPVRSLRISCTVVSKECSPRVRAGGGGRGWSAGRRDVVRTR